MMTRRFFWAVFALPLLATSCIDHMDNPVADINPETPAQQAFWAQFDSWQTDSCTVGDDFYMHMLGAWWNNPVDIYPGGLMPYAGELNDQRCDESVEADADLRQLMLATDPTHRYTASQFEAVISDRMAELWQGATTRQEALAALGRLWAAGYGIEVEPEATVWMESTIWKMVARIPAYYSSSKLFRTKEEMWRRLAPRQGVSLRRAAGQRAASVESDFEAVVSGMGINAQAADFEWDEGAATYFASLMEKLQTPADVEEYIRQSVYLMDGSLISSDILSQYVERVEAFAEDDIPPLTYGNLIYNLQHCMACIYRLRAYNHQFVTVQQHQRYTALCEEFRSAMRHRLETNEWLSQETRQNALDKLDAMMFFVSESDAVPACMTPQLTGTDMFSIVRQLRKARWDGFCWAAGRPRSETVWPLTLLQYASDYTVDNAFYNPNINSVVINPSNLLAPYVVDGYEESLQYAFLGTTIGHEITHGFDSSGAKYDKWGREEDWWTADDAQKFEVVCSRLADQYALLPIMPWVDPTQTCDGEKTLGENIADLGGCNIGLEILLSHHANASEAEQCALARRYFQGWAIQWSSSYSLEDALEGRESDVHSMARERTNGVVRNIDAWYDAYAVQRGALYLAPAQRARIW